MTILYIIVAVILLIIGFIAMIAFFMADVDNGHHTEELLPFIRVVAMFTAGSWLVALTWPVLLVSAVPLLILYGLWRLAVESTKAYRKYKEEKVKSTDV